MPATRRILRALSIPLVGISLGALMAPVAGADESGSRWSFGSQLGQVKGHDSSGAAGSALSAEDLTTMSYDVAATFGDKNRLGWRVFTGYRFSDYLAVHLGYTDLGKVHSRLIDDQRANFGEPVEFGLGTQTIRGVDLGLQVKMPVTERIAVELRGGKYFWKSRTRASASWGEEQTSTRRDSDNFFGAGVEVGVINDLSATLGWTRYEVAGEPIALWTVGVLYGFSYF